MNSGLHLMGEVLETKKNPNLILCGYSGSATEAFARNKNIPFIDLENPAAAYTDLKAEVFYFDAVVWAAGKGITTGTDKTHFSPGKQCTRGQVVTFLWRAMGSPEPTRTDHPFSDVKPNAYYYKAMLWALENGITTGTSATTFSPNRACTRQQVVSFLWRGFGSPAPTITENPFADVTEENLPAVLWALEKGITTGTTAVTFSPKRVCTRAQVVAFLYRAFN